MSSDSDVLNQLGSLDPKPFIRLFETAVAQLIQLRKNTSQGRSDLSLTLQEAESQQVRQHSSVDATLANILEDYELLYSRINSVGSRAVAMGSSLETLERNRQRAMDARELFLAYLECSNGDMSRLELLRNDPNPAGKTKCATLTRRLLSICKDLDVYNSSATKVSIEKYSETFEKTILKAFDRAYRKGDVREMASNAAVLYEFNRGHSVVQIFVNQHDFFITTERVDDDTVLGSEDVWTQLPDPDITLTSVEDLFSSLIEETKSTVRQESIIINEIFPNSTEVLHVFIQRIFAQVVCLSFQYWLSH